MASVCGPPARHHNDIRHFNVTRAKVDLIKRQLTELLTQYGDITMLMCDGWDAPWSRITYDEVPFHEIYELVKRLQPNCLVADLNASNYPSSALYYSDIKGFEQNAGQTVPGESAIPAVATITLTDGWFLKQADATRPLKSVAQVVDERLKPENNLHVNDGSFSSSFYLPAGQRSGWIEVTFDRERAFNTLVLVEPVGRWKDYTESRIAGYRSSAGWAGSGSRSRRVRCRRGCRFTR